MDVTPVNAKKAHRPNIYTQIATESKYNRQIFKAVGEL